MLSLSSPRKPESQFHEIAFESYGVPIGVQTDQPQLVRRLQGVVPARHRPAHPDAVRHRIVLTRRDDAHYNLEYSISAGETLDATNPNRHIANAVDLDLALAVLEAHVHNLVAQEAPEHVFVNAAVVEHRGTGVLLAGHGMSGRTTLARALVDAGAAPYSDLYAALDRDGRVHPYITSDREPGFQGQGIEVGAVVLTNYVPGADWRPRSLTLGQCTIELLTYTVPAQDRPEESMRAIRAALNGDPVMLSGDRGEAADTAPVLLEQIDR